MFCTVIFAYSFNRQTVFRLLYICGQYLNPSFEIELIIDQALLPYLKGFQFLYSSETDHIFLRSDAAQIATLREL
ncbi:hypothetical protein CS542_05090 [Pedobacter sp. IW39]|nr:hypothetical protein CS542_05090 [Pedobacter sp. IW39]